jgi:hypothetical protein
MIDIKFPPKLMIGGIEYTVEFVDNLGGLAAQIFFHEGNIKIVDSLSNSVALASLFHECQHGVFQHQAIFMKDQIYVDEQLVETSAQMWTQIFLQILEYNLHEHKKEEDVLVLNVEEF